MVEKSLSETFAQIYKVGEWGNGSGPGSGPANTIEYRAFVSRFIEANNVHHVTDLGCGDWQFSRLMDWSDVEYTGLDVVPDIVERNRKRFGTPNIRFDVALSPAAMPGGDLLLSKEVFQHLPNRLISEYIISIREKYRFALLTNATEPLRRVNVDIPPGGFRPVRLQSTPFNTPGAVVLTYYPQSGGYIFKNAVFLLLGSTR